MDILFHSVIEPLVRTTHHPIVQCIDVKNKDVLAGLATHCRDNGGELLLYVSPETKMEPSMELVQTASEGKCRLIPMPKDKIALLRAPCDMLLLDLNSFNTYTLLQQDLLQEFKRYEHDCAPIIVLFHALDLRIDATDFTPAFECLTIPGIPPITIFLKERALLASPALQELHAKLKSREALEEYTRLLLLSRAHAAMGNRALASNPEALIGSMRIAETMEKEFSGQMTMVNRRIQQEQERTQTLEGILKRIERTRSWRWLSPLRTAERTLRQLPTRLRERKRGLGVLIWSDGSGNLEQSIKSILPSVAAENILILDAAGHAETTLTAHAFSPPLRFLHGDWTSPLEAFRDAAPKLNCDWIFCMARPQYVEEEALKQCMKRLKKSSFRRFALFGGTAENPEQRIPTQEGSITYWPCAFLRKQDLLTPLSMTKFATHWGDLLGGIDEPLLWPNGLLEPTENSKRYCPVADPASTHSSYPSFP
jgi:hypothetical protein